MKALVEWLESLETVRYAIPCAVRINSRTYYGAVYKVAEPIGEYRFYLLGDKPKHKRTVYRPGNSPNENDWYISCWADWKVTRNSDTAQYHPFGPWFQLKAWNVPDGTTIDHYEITPRKRLQIEVK